MSAVIPVETIIIAEVAAGIFLLGLFFLALWFVGAVVREVHRRLKVLRYVYRRGRP
jgi:hypothetical protein